MKSIGLLCATSRNVFSLAMGITLCLFLTAPCPSHAFRKTSEVKAEFRKPDTVQAEFMKAIGRKDAKKIQELIVKGADVNTEFMPGFTPLSMAATNGDIETVRTLLELGADVNYKEKNITALYRAVFAKINGKEIVTMLLEAGADPDLQGESLIYLAKLGGENEMAAFLEEVLPDGGEREAGGQAEAGARGVATRNIMCLSSYRENALEPMEEQSYPPGDFIGPCEIFTEESPFAKAKLGNSGMDSLAATIFLEGRRVKKSGADEDAVAFIAAFITSEHSVRPPECKPVSLGPDGDYTKVVVKSVTDWVWECSYDAPPEKCLRLTRREKSKTWQSVYTYFNINKTKASDSIKELNTEPFAREIKIPPADRSLTVPQKAKITLSELLNERKLQKQENTPPLHFLFTGEDNKLKNIYSRWLSAQLQLDLYHVNLSVLVSKYIGETEKNLTKLFSAADNKDWILFFDEADALFGERTGVKDVHGKDTNQEVAYLLERIEKFEGVVLISCNSRDCIEEWREKKYTELGE
jgi:hypothetical protein